MIEKEIDRAKADFNNALEKNQSTPAMEGWILKTTEGGIPEIQSSKGEDRTLDDDLEIWHKVWLKAEQGSELHAAALIYIELANKEHFDTIQQLTDD